jgi:sec-independent protein translocase protein TatA
MFGLGLPEMIIISVVGVAIFGSKRIPELGKAVAQTIRSFKQEIKAESDPETSSNISPEISKTDDKN